jgi:hypothetical protein
MAQIHRFSIGQRSSWILLRNSRDSRRIFLGIKGLAAQTPPALCGSKTAQLPQFPDESGMPQVSAVPYLPK